MQSYELLFVAAAMPVPARPSTCARSEQMSVDSAGLRTEGGSVEDRTATEVSQSAAEGDKNSDETATGEAEEGGSAVDGTACESPEKGGSEAEGTASKDTDKGGSTTSGTRERRRSGGSQKGSTQRQDSRYALRNIPKLNQVNV